MFLTATTANRPPSRASRSIWFNFLRRLMNIMMKSLLMCAIAACCLISGFLSIHSTSAQQMGSIKSDHVLVQMDSERELLGRELIADIERCYAFMNRSIAGALPKRVLINVDWGQVDSSCNYRDGRIVIGMNQPLAMADERAFLAHSIAREMARMGLLILSQGAQREDTEFLFEGMLEILVHEYNHTSRSLEAAWATSRLLDEMQALGLTQQRSWNSFSRGSSRHRNAAPGITFLQTFRELQGRDRPVKLFEELKKKSLVTALEAAFKAPVADVERIWLDKVREYSMPDEITINSAGAPKLDKAETSPQVGKPGDDIQLRLFFRNANPDLTAGNVFLKDERSSRVILAEPSTDKNAGFLKATFHIDENCPPGTYSYQTTAIDDGGNLRTWKGVYVVGNSQ